MTKEKADSSIHREQQFEQLRKEALAQQAEAEALRELEKRDAEERAEMVKAENEVLLEKWAGPISPGETRDNLLERIRKMREYKPPEIKPMGRTPEQEAQLKIEQEEGRKRVALAEAEETRNRAIRAKMIEEDKAREAAKGKKI